MAISWTTRLSLARLMALESWRSALAWLRREGDRVEAALRFARAHSIAGDPDSVLGALDRYARERRFLMNVGDEKGLVLDEAVRGRGSDARILELGCFCGYSAIRMARLLKGAGSVTSLELNADYARVAREMVALAGLAGRVDIRRGKASDLIPALSGPFDLVFLDHWMDRYLPDLELIEARGLLAPGAVVVADNVGPLFGADAYLGHVRSSGRYDSRYVAAHVEYQEALEDGVEISVWRG